MGTWNWQLFSRIRVAKLGMDWKEEGRQKRVDRSPARRGTQILLRSRGCRGNLGLTPGGRSAMILDLPHFRKKADIAPYLIIHG